MDSPLMFPFNFSHCQGAFPTLYHQQTKIQENSFLLNVYLQKENEVKKVMIGEDDIKGINYDVKKKRWTEAEDKKLLLLVKNREVDWEEISSHFPKRNAKMCYNRHRRLQSSNYRSWTQSDEKKLMKLVGEHGENWKNIKSYFPQKNQKQVKDHYMNYLRPDLIHSQWDFQADLKFLKLLSMHGCEWSQIQKHMPERSYPQIKNRYYGKIAKLIAAKLKLELTI